MSDNTVFAVPKDRQRVTIRLVQGVALEGEIFIEPVPQGHSIHQKVCSFIENSNRFFPLKAGIGGSTEFINKNKVQVLEVSFIGDPEISYFANFHMHTIPVMAHFLDGSTVSGELMAEVPQEKTRLSDCLNLPDKFLYVRSENKMCYINKGALQKVVHG